MRRIGSARNENGSPALSEGPMHRRLIAISVCVSRPVVIEAPAPRSRAGRTRSLASTRCRYGRPPLALWGIPSDDLKSAHPPTAHPASVRKARQTLHHRALGGWGGKRTRKRHQQEHRPQRSTESSDPTQHAKGRTGDRPGPRKGATTRRNVTQGGMLMPTEPQRGRWWTTRMLREMAAKTEKRPPQQPAQPQFANHWARLTRKQHQQEHRPQPPSESIDPTQHAKGRTGDCPGPVKK